LTLYAEYVRHRNSVGSARVRAGRPAQLHSVWSGDQGPRRSSGGLP